jgi:hypothetical protein
MYKVGGFKLFTGLLVLSAAAASCGGDDASRDSLLNANVASISPTASAVSPAPGATGVSVDTRTVTASFSQPVVSLASPASFTVTCAAPCISPAATVALDAAGTGATLTFATGTRLAPLTVYTATVGGASARSNGASMAAPLVWRFTTGLVPTAPTVTAVAPANGSTSVAINLSNVNAAFSEPVQAITGANFTVTCASPCTSPTGTTALNAAGTIATFTLTAGTALEPLTLYTGTISGARGVNGGIVMQSPFVWTFLTTAITDTTRPRVSSTNPATSSPGPTTGVPANTAVSVIFTESMAASTLNASSFTLTCSAPCVSPAGSVSYSVGTRTALFTPTAPLAVGATYTATVTTAATDLAGNQLAGNSAPLPAASNYVWTFTTGAVVPPANVSVLLTQPTSGGGICPSGDVNATFTVPSGLRMDPNTVTAINFTVTGPAPGLVPVVASSVVLDVATGRIATFTPVADLTVGLVYSARVVGGPAGVRDMAVPANTMLNDFVWTFTVTPAGGNCVQPVALNAAEPFGTFGGSAGMTNSGIQTVINGDIGTISTTTSTVTGFHDNANDVYTEVPGANIGRVNGTIFTCTTSTTGPTSGAVNQAACDIATDARLDAETAYNELVGLPGGPDPGAGNLANLVLAPGVYTASLGSFMIQGGNLTLDAQGDANAVFVFQMATSLTVGGPGAAFPQSITLVGGAQGRNVYWQVGSAATINAGGGGTMEGTIIAEDGVVISTAGSTILTTLNGRALSLGASVTMVDTIINVPAP